MHVLKRSLNFLMTLPRLLFIRHFCCCLFILILYFVARNSPQSVCFFYLPNSMYSTYIANRYLQLATLSTQHFSLFSMNLFHISIQDRLIEKDGEGV